jgi:putative transposase
MTIVDIFSHVSDGLWVGYRARAIDVVDALDRTIAAFGCARSIRIDNGSQFTSKQIDLWANANKVTLAFPRSGKPKDNAFVETFKGKVRAECND